MEHERGQLGFVSQETNVRNKHRILRIECFLHQTLCNKTKLISLVFKTSPETDIVISTYPLTALQTLLKDKSNNIII